MNPFWHNPKTVVNLQAAKTIIGLYKAEIALTIAQKVPLEESLAASCDVIVKAHPELSDIQADLELISDQGKAVGHLEGQREDLDILLDEFTRSLPYAIRQQLQAEIKAG